MTYTLHSGVHEWLMACERDEGGLYEICICLYILGVLSICVSGTMQWDCISFAISVLPNHSSQDYFPAKATLKHSTLSELANICPCKPK